MKITKCSFEQLFHSCWKRLYSFAIKTVGSEDDAKEIVQEVFKSMWERRAELQLQDAERYLLRSVKLRSLEYLRNQGSEKRQKEVILNLKTRYIEENQLLYKELEGKLKKEIEALPDQYENNYERRSKAGFSNKEITSNLLVAERSEKNHIHKALSVICLKLTNRFNITEVKSD